MVLPSNRKSSIMKVGAIYARYSSRFQHSIEDQIRVCRDWAGKNGIEVPDDLIFVDRAVTGKSSRRQGLKDFQKALADNRAGVAILFTTNRLYRKFYQSLAFVEEQIVDRGKRAVFVKSGPIDTEDKEHWRKLLHIHALMDEFVVQTIAAHVQSAHEGLLLQCRVFGTVAFGFSGEEIAGCMTKLGRPAKRLIVDTLAAEWVKKIFQWFTTEHCTIREIVRRLNADGAPLPPRSPLKRWSRLAVRRLLANPRYRGWWEYGRFQSVWVNKPGYSRQQERDEPLAGVQIESLRIIDDPMWHATQERLEKLAQNGGRSPADGDRHSRPRVLNGLVFCHKHNRVLYVHGPYGKYLSCKACREEAEPELYSFLPRRLSLELVCDRLADLLQGDESLVEQALQAFRQHLQDLTRPDMSRAKTLRRDIDRQTRQINFVLDAPGDSEQDQKENRERLGRLRGERAANQTALAEIEEAAKKPAQLPSVSELKAHVDQIKATLREAARSDDPAELAALHDLIKDLTGGKIVAIQQGEREANKGWIRLTFGVNALNLVASRNGFPEVQGDSAKVEIDVKAPNWRDQKCEEVKVLYDKDFLEKEIADQLHLHRSQVSMLLKHWEKKHGQKLPDGRKRRATLPRKQQNTPVYKAIADDAAVLWNDPANLAVQEIARRLSTSDTTAWKAIAYWHRNQGLPVPTAKQRRERTMARAKMMFVDNMEIKEIAKLLGYTARGMKLLLKEAFARSGELMPDGRAHRHRRKKAS
jgi:hypothetical protein